MIARFRALKAGERLGPYEIVALLGAGGMGEVWRARDTRLGRDVAVKVLPYDFAEDSERRQRFEREARSMASLSHPNVISIFDVGERERVPYIVEELLEGESLRARLGSGPVGWRTAAGIAGQIALGLAAAHERGIVHRDLKPENVFVAPDGRVKVLDFGLAKRFEPAGPEQAETLSRIPAGETEPGHVMGTIGYMAPEQLRGQPADPRSDLFALGVVLHELIAGANPFRRQTPAETSSALLTEEPPDLSASPVSAPPGLARVAHRLLEKNPARRFQSAADVAFALDGLASGSAISGAAPTAAAPGKRHPPLIAFAGASLLLAVFGFLAGSRLGRPAGLAAGREPRIFRTGIEPELVERGDTGARRPAAISPNGRMLAIHREGRLWVRELGSLALRELPGTAGAEEPVWSPDSAEIAFWDGRRLRRVPAAGGAVSVIGEPEGSGSLRFLGGSWGPGGNILVALVPGSVFRVPAQGGRLEVVQKVDPSAREQDFHGPVLLPDGKSFLYVHHPAGSMLTQLWVSHEGKRRPVLPNVADAVENPFYSSDGFVLFERIRRGKTIMAVPFSAERGEATGQPFVVLEDAMGPTVSSDGTLAAVTGGASRPFQIVRISRDGALLGTVGEPMDALRGVSLSRDGSRAAFTAVVEDGVWGVWVYDLLRGGKVRVTSPERASSSPAWSPSGDTLTFTVDDGTASFSLHERRADGTGPVEILVDSRSLGGSATQPEVSPDGTKLLFNVAIGGQRPGVGGQLYLLDRASKTRPPRPWPEGTGTPGGEGSTNEKVLTRARISPNGRWVAYASSVTGKPEVYVRPFPEGSARWTVSVDGGASPAWSPRGDELFFLAGNTLMVSRVETAGPFRAGTPRPLIDGDRAGVWFYSFNPWISSYEIGHDGREILAVRPAGGMRSELLVYENWRTAFRK